jgi:chromosomal replication initiator protein
MEMSKLEERILTRLEWGLLADVQPPDLETRMAITRSKAIHLGLVLSDDIVEYIAENTTSNIRQIEGVIHKLTAFQSLMNTELTISLVDRAIKEVNLGGVFVPTPEIIITETARYFGIPEDLIIGQNRQKNISYARQVAMYLCRTLVNTSLEDIGSRFDNRNHSTVLSSIRKIEDLVKTSPDVAGAVRDITSNISAKNKN